MRDLHLHLGGSTPLPILWSLIVDSGYKSKIKDYNEFCSTMLMRDRVESFDQYIQTLKLVEKVQSSPAAVQKSVYWSFVHAFLGGSTSLELRWDPTHRNLNGSIDLDTLIISARAGKERAAAIFGIDSTMALCMGRDNKHSANIAILNKALQYAGKGVSAIDLAGPYSCPLPDKSFLIEAYNSAVKNGLKTTMHVGEIDHDTLEEELEFAVNKLDLDRIGHGIRITDYPSLLKLAVSKGITFEICISSNLMTRSVKSLGEFRKIFKTFEEYGAKICLCTDSTELLGTTILKEYRLYEEIKSMKDDHGLVSNFSLSGRQHDFSKIQSIAASTASNPSGRLCIHCGCHFPGSNIRCKDTEP